MGGDQVITLSHGKAANVRCTVRQFGATVIGWEVDEVHHIFVSSNAVMDGSKAIRGGIPVCFPAFGPWSFGAQHGFARTSQDWAVTAGPDVDDRTGDVALTLTLTDNDETRKIWDKKFKLDYTITLTTRALKLELDIQNTGSTDLDELSFALHTYYSVPDVGKVRISNLKGLKYTDKVDGGREKQEESDVVAITGFTDRVYQNAGDECVLEGLDGGRALVLSKTNFSDFVVWNPWSENAAKMSDFGDADYKGMVCVEAAQASAKVNVKPGQRHRATHTIAIKD